LTEAPSRLLGSVSLVHLNWDACTAEIGYWLLPEARGRGLAKRSVRLVATWAFDVVGLAELRAEVFDGNDASWQVLMANGFRQVGHEVITHRGQQRGQRLAARENK
jgi:RimJ/RimL family protein N-acetyltransferase